VYNPFRSEAEAYRFLLLTVGYFAAIVIASVAGGRWAGLAVFVILTSVGVFVWLRRREAAGPRRTPAVRRGTEDEHRILVVANETVGGQKLLDCIDKHARDFRANVLVVSPALNSRLRHWVSDEDQARSAAQARLAASLARLAAAGIDAEGEIGDAEPLQAIEDAVRTFGPDEIIISTHPPGRSVWLEHGLVNSARERFDVHITHVVTDLGAESDEIAGEHEPLTQGRDTA
jgi:hypothetical protein